MMVVVVTRFAAVSSQQARNQAHVRGTIANGHTAFERACRYLAFFALVAFVSYRTWGDDSKS